MEYLNFIVNEIHTIIAATIDDDGLPVTCAIDIMDADENGLYFLTAKGKGFYKRLKQHEYIALTGIKGENTMSCIAVSIRGKVKEMGDKLLPKLFDKNPYMKEIYPTVNSQKALTVFKIYEGSGEWFNLSKKPIERFSFAFGNMQIKTKGYFITNACIGCRQCQTVCPQNCIDFTFIPAIIQKEHCLNCGNCMSICPYNAVIQEG